MANRLEISLLNPIKLVVQNAQQNFNTVHLDDGLQSYQFLSFQQHQKYNQKWLATDSINLQLASNFGPISYKIIDCKNAVYKSGNFTTINTSYFTNPLVGYFSNISLSGLANNIYYLQVTVGAGSAVVNLISEPFEIRSNWPNTKLLTYTNSENNFSLIFQNGETFNFRVEAALQDFQPASNDVSFEDEPANLTILSSKIYRTYKAIFGTALGLPDWVADKILRIFACDSVIIDGKSFTKNDGAKLEPNRDRLNAFAGWSLELRESKARTAYVIENNISLDLSISVLYDLEVVAFGDLNNPPFSTDLVISKNE